MCWETCISPKCPPPINQQHHHVLIIHCGHAEFFTCLFDYGSFEVSRKKNRCFDVKFIPHIKHNTWARQDHHVGTETEICDADTFTATKEEITEGEEKSIYVAGRSRSSSLLQDIASLIMSIANLTTLCTISSTHLFLTCSRVSNITSLLTIFVSFFKRFHHLTTDFTIFRFSHSSSHDFVSFSQSSSQFPAISSFIFRIIKFLSFNLI